MKTSVSDVQKNRASFFELLLFFISGVELECEGVDRADMNLAGKQEQIIKDAILYGIFECPC